MKSFIKVTVTKEHIRKGKRSSCTKCPVHLALEPYFGEDFTVFTDGIEFPAPNNWYCTKWLPTPIPLPPDARSFIYDFDEKQPVKPFTFYLPVG